jgi:crossover junction endodeoxyribonuclease RuvC
MKASEADKIILGIDPGTRVMGFAVIHAKGQKLEPLEIGVLRLATEPSHAIRLSKIFNRILELIQEFLPDEIAIESPFQGKNAQSAIKLGRAQGVAMAAAIAREIPVVEYAPKKIKQSITGNGNAAKEQVAAMLATQLKLNLDKVPNDATDALAVALCHHFQKNAPARGAKSWGQFLKSNPERLKS